MEIPLTPRTLPFVTMVGRGGRGPVDDAATLSRSIRLVRDFRLEQSDPDRFYQALAADSVRQVGVYADLAGQVLLDVGGGPGFFADEFTAAGASYVPCDVDAGELRLHGRTPGPRTVQGSGMALPFRTGAFDVCYSSNVLEHVPEPWTMADEMLRVTRPGGTVFLSYTLWFGPWGGHETSPWHYLGGRRAADRYAARFGHRPKNDFGVSMFPVTARAGLEWARVAPGADLIAAVPRYLPRRAAWIVRLPGIREVIAWNLLLVLRVTR